MKYSRKKRISRRKRRHSRHIKSRRYRRHQKGGLFDSLLGIGGQFAANIQNSANAFNAVSLTKSQY